MPELHDCAKCGKPTVETGGFWVCEKCKDSKLEPEPEPKPETERKRR